MPDRLEGDMYRERRVIEIDENCPAYTAERRLENGSPVLYLNGKKTAPLIYALSDVPASGPLTAQAQKNIAQFAEQGIHIFSADVNLAQGWHRTVPYRPEFLLGDLTAILETDPQAAVILRLHVNPPYWWMRDNPDEMCIYGRGGVPYIDDGDYERLIDRDEWNLMRVSLASAKWKKDASEALEALLKGVRDTPQGRRVVGIQIACGVYGEWHQWGFTYGPDYGRPMTDYFRAYLRETYKTDEALRKAWGQEDVSIETAVPAPPEIRDGENEGPYRVPADCVYAADSMKALQRCVPDAILFFAECIRSVWGRPLLIGTFYSYYDGWERIWVGGHLEPNRLYEKGLIDYVSGPFHYNEELRGISGAGCARGLIESVRLNGVLWLTEMDNPPIGSARCVGGLPERRRESIAIMRRQILEPFTRGMGAWFFDHRLALELGYDAPIYIKKGWWDHPALLREVGILKRIADRTARTPYRSEAEVLCVFDTVSRYYGNASDAFSYRNLPLIFNTLGKSGFSYDSVCFDDLEKADLARYRCVLFVHVPYLTERRRRFIRDTVAKDGRILIWINTAGYLCDTSASPDNISDAAGISVRNAEGVPSTIRIRYGGEEYRLSACEPYSLLFSPCGEEERLGYFDGTDTPAAAKRVFRDHTAFYFSVFPSDNALMRKICGEAGVHIYSNGGETLSAGNGILAVCTEKARAIRIRLRNGTEIGEDLPAMTTAVYDEETGERLDLPGCGEEA